MLSGGKKGAQVIAAENGQPLAESNPFIDVWGPLQLDPAPMHEQREVCRALFCNPLLI